MLMPVRNAVSAFMGLPQWGWRLVVALASALIAGGALRLITVTLAMAMSDSAAAGDPEWTTAIAQEAIALSLRDFVLAVGIGSFGGFVSLMSELRRSWPAFNLMSGIGHMGSAQFASLITYLIAVSQKIDIAMALVGAGIFGWLGNVGLLLLSRIASARLGLHLPGAVDLPPAAPPER